MADQHEDQIIPEEDEGEQYIDTNEVEVELQDDADYPMEEEDEDDIATGSAAGPSRSAENNSVQDFHSHDGSVFSVACHPTEPLAATGGEDDVGYIWDITDGEVIEKLTGHTDSVTSIAFSTDGEMIATGGMDGKVRVWRRVGKENYRIWEFLTELQGPDEVMFLRWHPKGPALLAGSNDSTLVALAICMQSNALPTVPSGNTMQVFAGHTGAVNCGEFTPDGKKIVSACADNTFIIWDPRSPTPTVKLTADDARFNLDGVTSLSVNLSSTLAVVGGAAGSVRVVSLTKGEVVAALGGHKEGESVEAIDAITSLLVHPAPKPYIVVSGCADGTLRTWDVRTGTIIKEHKGHTAPVLGASLGLNGSVVVSGGDDDSALVFTTEPVDDE
ncbi:WD40-repeat-containing domain protein [Amanita rubescens]|nr:WD40-repeat-containing domain protein [Amanita rubescens]